jgi:hypothetical protein
MSEAKHTPGPWRVELDEVDLKEWPHPRIMSINGTCVAGVQYTRDAPLIAAAPKLLKACEIVLKAIEWEYPHDRMTPEEQASMLRDVIAKATGGES